MPAKATIFDAAKCEPKYQLGAGPHNTVRWNPFGRFVLLAGFGNLPGDMKFFDRKADGKYKLVGATRAACSVTAEWSPDGRRLLTATVAPRLNVDNGFKIWRYNGELLHHEPREKLYEARWVPAPAGVHADRPISPGSVRKETDADAPGANGNGAPKKAAPYRPPHATSGSGNFSLAKAAPEDAGPGKYRPPGAVSVASAGAKQPSGPPGASFVEPAGQSKSAAKNAKKRAAAKAKKEAEAAAAAQK
jgi:translation initiation factor 2A